MGTRQIFWGVVFVFLGLILVGKASGMALPSIWAWWPIFLIALGLDMSYTAARGKGKGKPSFVLAFIVLFGGIAALGNSILNWPLASVGGGVLLGFGLGLIADGMKK